MSQPTRVRAMVFLAFALTLAAGVIVGVAYARQLGDVPQSVKTTGPAAEPSSKPSQNPATTQAARDPFAWFAKQLDLTEQQKGEVGKIWAAVPHAKLKALDEQRKTAFRQRWQQSEDVTKSLTSEQRSERDRISADFEGRVREMYRQRDAAIEAIYTDDQKARREQSNKEFTATLAAIAKDQDALLEPTSKRIRELLSPDQAKKFDQLARGGGAGGPGRGGPDNRGHRGGPQRPGSQPTTRPQGFGPSGGWPGGPAVGQGGPPPQFDGGPGPDGPRPTR